MMEKFALALVVLLADVLSLLLIANRGAHHHQEFNNRNLCHRNHHNQPHQHHHHLNDFRERANGETSSSSINNDRQHQEPAAFAPWPSLVLFAEAKGVAGLGKAGGDGTGGSDKAGQQVPPEVYNALTYAGTAFLFTLSVPLILYGLNKLLNKIEDCFGCGPSSKRNNNNKNEKTPKKKKPPGSAIVSSSSLSPQQFENQQPPANNQNNYSPSQPNSQSTTKFTSAINPNSGHIPLLGQLKSLPNVGQLKSPTTNTTITLPFDSTEFDYKTPIAAGAIHQNFQQPYIISSPHL